MLPDSLLLKVIEWGAQAVSAAKTKAQQRDANLLGHAAFLVAGLRYLDRRFVELFVPLTMYDAGSWPLQRRREHAEAILGFMTSPDVIPRLASSIQWLESSPARDPDVDALVRLLCDTVKLAVWATEDADVGQPPPTSGYNDASWMDNAKIEIPPAIAMGVGSSSLRRRTDPDDAAMPAVRRLVQLLRETEPVPDEVADAAGACLIRPAQFAAPAWDPTPVNESWPAPRPTVSPLRGFADSADAHFSALLAIIQQTFPAIPAPAWMWQL